MPDTPEGGDFAIVADGKIIAEAFRRTARNDVQPAEANARLIAAAPELATRLGVLADRARRVLSAIDQHGRAPPELLEYLDKQIALADELLTGLA